MWELVGIAASVLTNIGLLVQVIHGIRTRKLTDLSYGMLTLLGVGLACWLAYGIHLADWVIVTANIAGVSFVSMLLAMKYAFSK